MEISLCLSDLGDLTLSSNVDIYSNSDNYTTPLYTNIPVNNLFGANCTFTAIVPDDATMLLLNDPIENCNTFFPIVSSDFCDDCNLRFDVFSAGTVGRIVAGNLISDCDDNVITDYIIDWYGPNSTTNIQYTSGFGTAFTGYSYTHPLTDDSAIFAQEGEYIPRIRFVKINGNTFSQSGGTGSFLGDINSCFSGLTTFTSGFTCSNGVSTISGYTHEVNFSGVGDVLPPPLQSTIILTSTTNYFAWAFKGEEFPDTLRFTFSGSSYSDLIVFEDVTLGWGSDITTGTFLPSEPSKSGRTTSGDIFIKKVNVLTGLTINDGDKIIIDIIPSRTVNETNWGLYFNPCLTTFDCTNCNIDTPYARKMVGNSISMTNQGCIDYFTSPITGCPLNEVISTDVYQYLGIGIIQNNPFKYINQQSFSSFIDPPNISGRNSRNSFLTDLKYVNQTFYTDVANCNYCYNNFITIKTCEINGNNFIRYEKSNTGIGGTGVFKMTFDDISDYNFYLDEIIQFSGITINGNGSCSELFINDPTRCEYYRYFRIYVPQNTSQTNSANCGDNLQPLVYYFHPTSILTTTIDIINDIYTIELTMPTITNQITGVTCGNCISRANTMVTYGNNSSLATTQINGRVINLTTNNGSRYNEIMDAWLLACPQITTVTAVTKTEYYALPKYLNETYMYSGSPLTLIPSLSAETCNFIGKAYLDTNSPSFYETTTNGGSYICYINFYKITYTDLDNWKIQAEPIINGVRTSPLVDAYVVVGGVVTFVDPAYIWT